MNFARYFRTARHLRAAQLFGQIRQRTIGRFKSPVDLKGCTWQFGDHEVRLDLAAPVLPQEPGRLATGQFCFIGQGVDFQGMPDWDAPGQSRLWRYNLHYFDWLWSLLPEHNSDWKTARQLTLNWIANHPPRKGACGWEPYPTSLRLINWTLMFGVRNRKEFINDCKFSTLFLESVSNQVSWLEKNFETHIQANHLLENIAALICVASIFEGKDQDRLKGKMVPWLKNELSEQILPDGMHYERSPMYHLRVMWLLEMLEQIGDDDLKAIVSEPFSRSKSAIGCLRHPDGEIAQFNDAAIGVYQDNWREHPIDGAWCLPDAGYYGFREGRDYYIADCGAVGPDHQPGHAHADYLSFELSFGGERVITDTGIGTYETGLQRRFERSTSSHNTIEIAGENSAEVWGGFRVGRRTKPRLLSWNSRSTSCLLEAEHHGYLHLPGKPVHRRSFLWENGCLVIRDRISGRQAHPLVSRLHLAPGVEVAIADRQVKCRAGNLQFVIEIDGPGEIAIESCLAYPRFGIPEARKVIGIHAMLSPPRLEWIITFRKI